MKNIYNAPNKEVAATELDNLEKKWAGKYPFLLVHRKRGNQLLSDLAQKQKYSLV